MTWVQIIQIDRSFITICRPNHFCKGRAQVELLHSARPATSPRRHPNFITHNSQPLFPLLSPTCKKQARKYISSPPLSSIKETSAFPSICISHHHPHHLLLAMFVRGTLSAAQRCRQSDAAVSRLAAVSACRLMSTAQVHRCFEPFIFHDSFPALPTLNLTDRTCFQVKNTSQMQNLGIDVPLPTVERFDPPHRLLAGPGPGNAHPHVHAAMTLPQARIFF
jgi:hypothetical protein